MIQARRKAERSSESMRALTASDPPVWLGGSMPYVGARSRKERHVCIIEADPTSLLQGYSNGCGAAGRNS